MPIEPCRQTVIASHYPYFVELYNLSARCRLTVAHEVSSDSLLETSIGRSRLHHALRASSRLSRSLDSVSKASSSNALSVADSEAARRVA